MTPLGRILIDQIKTTGPMNLADFMAECLLHPKHGYYATRDPFGTKGDFTTAPEISQMFGELIGLCLAQSWLDQGSPNPFILAELGPGRGTLMRDILRATAGVPGFTQAAKISLVEASETLRKVQKETLSGHEVHWFDTVNDIPNLPLLLIANEFFDALPIRQFQRDGDGWREVTIGTRNQSLVFGLTGLVSMAELDHRLSDTKPGDIVETCPGLPPIVHRIATGIVAKGGAALIVDYGDWRSAGDTLQALKSHAYVDPLSTPGDADLTAHVDFEAIARNAQLTRSIRCSGMTRQGVFLERLGITQRAQNLASRLAGDDLRAHIEAHRRLTHPEEMGSLFKVIGISPSGVQPLAGLDL